eukprot:CAMPEP_0185023492 /NCGR_PEP_ID=MMETSP1103-20130426/6159_1 /TAXON_ID=36769 /ORGANISM="Paraphysomonas bandaiensis, Strain Caron Lab Isolate" /LENGTH=127 /DNA_ID=CAMNT_0027556107 /DNA_START=89 /DNA_END=472 /DNA_ORIENTATION=+
MKSYFIAAVLCASACFLSVQADGEVWVCSIGDERFLGKYTSGNEMDDAPTYVNDNGMAFFRNNKFWYLGSLESWPPVTYYRCVDYEGCNANEVIPPSPGKWTTNKKFGKEPTPVVSMTPCDQGSEEL